MTRYAVIENNIVTNVILANEPPQGEELWVATEVAGPGWGYDDGVFIAPVYEPAIPSRVTSRQFKLQLLADGLIDEVEEWVYSQPREIQIAYENSGTFVREEPMMQAGFAGLGLTPEQVDAFFLAASNI
jgi:hypothetical protein